MIMLFAMLNFITVCSFFVTHNIKCSDQRNSSEVKPVSNEACSLCGVSLEELDVRAFAVNEESNVMEGICAACWTMTIEE